MEGGVEGVCVQGLEAGWWPAPEPEWGGGDDGGWLVPSWLGGHEVRKVCEHHPALCLLLPAPPPPPNTHALSWANCACSSLSLPSVDALVGRDVKTLVSDPGALEVVMEACKGQVGAGAVHSRR